MKQNRIDRIMKELESVGISQMLIVDPMSIYYLTDVMNHPGERFYALLLRRDGHHIYFLNKLFTIPQEVGAEKVWYSDTDPVMDIVASYIDHSSPLGVDKDLKARFLLPLIEKNAATAFMNTSLAVDTVRGIKDEEEQEKIWKRFYRADTSRTDEESTGLGLSMVRQIARLHGGVMTLESQVGVGSTFALVLKAEA